MAEKSESQGRLAAPTGAGVLKSQSLGELASLYGVSKKTLRKWLQPFFSEVGHRNGRYYTPLQVGVIIEKLGPF